MSDLFGFPVSARTVHRMTEECAEALAGAEARLKDSVTAASVIGAEETGLRVAGANHCTRRQNREPDSLRLLNKAREGGDELHRDTAGLHGDGG